MQEAETLVSGLGMPTLHAGREQKESWGWIHTTQFTWVKQSWITCRPLHCSRDPSLFWNAFFWKLVRPPLFQEAIGEGEGGGGDDIPNSPERVILGRRHFVPPKRGVGSGGGSLAVQAWRKNIRVSSPFPGTGAGHCLLGSQSAQTEQQLFRESHSLTLTFTDTLRLPVSYPEEDGGLCVFLLLGLIFASSRDLISFWSFYQLALPLGGWRRGPTSPRWRPGGFVLGTWPAFAKSSTG